MTRNSRPWPPRRSCKDRLLLARQDDEPAVPRQPQWSRPAAGVIADVHGGSGGGASEGSLLPCGWGDGATPTRPITGRPSLAPASFTHCPIRSSYGFPPGRVRTGEQRAYHVPRVKHLGGLGRASTPVVRHLRVPGSERHNLTTFRLVQACQHLWLVLDDGAGDASHPLNLPPYPGPRPPRCWQSPRPLTASRLPRKVIRCPGSFALPRYQGRTSRWDTVVVLVVPDAG